MQEFLAGENRYALLERLHPEDSKKLRVQIEKDYMKRYEILEHLAAADYFEPKAHTPEEPEGSAEACEVAPTPEHARPDTGEPCDDGRAGK
jgi:pyruvate-ferredoxin/flavodoxin oxidoreductase